MVGGDYCKTKLAFVLIVLCIHCINVDGRRNKDMPMHMHQGTLKTIESDDGDVIDCVEINKQPAFNHPLLRNHSIQMTPNFHASGGPSSNKENPVFSQSWHKNGECPEGTIPITRTQKHQYPPRSYPPIPLPNDTNQFQLPPRHEYAQVTLIGDIFYGAHAFMNIWHPTAYHDEHSKAHILVLAGHDRELNSIEAGWMVNAGDNVTRLFIYWTSDGYQNTGCYNLLCPGFVHVNNKFTLGGSVEPVSTYNGDQFEIDVIIKKDETSGNWWLVLGNQIVGYWPGSIFTSLADTSTAITWGGEVLNRNVDGHHTLTQMGSGHFPSEGFGNASYFRNLGYYDHQNNLKDAGDLMPYASRTLCYDVKIAEDKEGLYRTHFYFGGPGFSIDCL